MPVYSGKRLGTRVPPDLVLIVFIGVVLFFALLISYPWEVLTIGTIVYLASLPFGVLSYREHTRRNAQAAAAAQPGNVATLERPPSEVPFDAKPDSAKPDTTKPDAAKPDATEVEDGDRPTRH